MGAPLTHPSRPSARTFPPTQKAPGPSRPALELERAGRDELLFRSNSERIRGLADSESLRGLAGPRGRLGGSPSSGSRSSPRGETLGLRGAETLGLRDPRAAAAAETSSSRDPRTPETGDPQTREGRPSEVAESPLGRPLCGRPLPRGDLLHDSHEAPGEDPDPFPRSPDPDPRSVLARYAPGDRVRAASEVGTDWSTSLAVEDGRHSLSFRRGRHREGHPGGCPTL